MQRQPEEFLAPGDFMESPFDGIDLTKSELAAKTVRRFGELRLRVTGSSMLPAILPGDVLRIRNCRIDQAGPGDIVLFIRHRRLFAHRAIARSGAGLLTQGDALAEPDPPVTADELLGRVTRIMRRGKTVPHESKPTLPARLAAALFRRSATAGRVFTRLQGLQGGVGL